jgi:hypothetical protein
MLRRRGVQSAPRRLHEPTANHDEHDGTTSTRNNDHRVLRVIVVIVTRGQPV